MKVLIHKRLFSVSRLRKNLSVLVSEEIKSALQNGSKPVVSLESTIITHGLPYPENLQMAQKVETVVRDNGAIPATCAFVDGKPYVGLTNDQLVRLAETAASGKVNKVSRRDIGYTMANRLNGGTTIASTMILSKLAGIKVFATGGLGGVHKDGQNTFDVSADLTELGRTPVSVVCSGPKSILDIGLTLEYLETQGVFVGTYNDDGRTKVQVPGFYCRESGHVSPYSFSSFEEAASIIHNQNNIMSLSSGNLLCIPPPKESALSSSFINEIIDRANEEALQQGIKGKELTPFLLSKIAKDTNGKSVECNVKFVLNNAKAASEIATALLHLENGTKVKDTITYQPILQNFQPVKTNNEENVNTVIIGSLAMDTISQMKDVVHVKDSNIASIKSSVGGVGFNVSLACHYGLQSILGRDTVQSSKLISIVGNDFAGKSIINQLQSLNVDTSGILVSDASTHSTAQYMANHEKNGELIVASADMSIIEEDFSDHVIDQLTKIKPSTVVFDCNVSPYLTSTVLEYIRNLDEPVNVIIEPTSFPKSSRISSIRNRPFPNNTIKLVTPTIKELEGIYASFQTTEKFDDYDEWFPALDVLGINSVFREKLNTMSNINKHPVLKELLNGGAVQQSFQLLPYFQNILIKLGEDGVLLVSLSENVKDYKSIPTTSSYKPSFTITSEGRIYGDNKQMGVVIQYFPIPEENKNIKIANVTGAGDSLLGVLVAQLSTSEYNWLNTEIDSVEQEWFKWESINKAQLASGLTLKCNSAVSQDIATLK
ncbi:uncharacterized protein RJT20DRAFT_23252 [Scheffersomyces xylosifermentans]|uniref:uncharacterized protein n=1 Tax=Scheffersomyces xylosifermentans TaxID=1304137 RepID=UPI00315D8778